MNRATWIGSGAILLWASLALLTTATASIPPFELLALSFAVAFAASAAVLASGGRASLRCLRQPWAAWALGFCGILFCHALYFVALKVSPPAEASLVAYLWPLLIVLLSAALPGERLHWRQCLGAMLGLAGTALALRQCRHETGSAPPLGYAAAAGCTVVWSGYSVLNRRFAALGPVGLAFFAWDHATKARPPSHARHAVLPGPAALDAAAGRYRPDPGEPRHRCRGGAGHRRRGGRDTSDCCAAPRYAAVPHASEGPARKLRHQPATQPTWMPTA